jgi:hypothetical protein
MEDVTNYLFNASNLRYSFFSYTNLLFSESNVLCSLLYSLSLYAVYCFVFSAISTLAASSFFFATFDVSSDNDVIYSCSLDIFSE